MPCHPRHSNAVSRWRSSGTLSRTCAFGVFFSACAQHRQHSMGQHGQRDVPVPTLPVANLVVIQPAFALGSLKALLDLPALCGHSDKRLQRIFRRRSETRTSVLRRSADDTDPVERIIVANANQLVIVTALADPPPRPRLIDRFLVAAYDAGLSPLLCLTKLSVGAV